MGATVSLFHPKNKLFPDRSHCVTIILNFLIYRPHPVTKQSTALASKTTLSSKNFSQISSRKIHRLHRRRFRCYRLCGRRKRRPSYPCFCGSPPSRGWRAPQFETTSRFQRPSSPNRERSAWCRKFLARPPAMAQWIFRSNTSPFLKHVDVDEGWLLIVFWGWWWLKGARQKVCFARKLDTEWWLLLYFFIWDVETMWFGLRAHETMAIWIFLLGFSCITNTGNTVLKQIKQTTKCMNVDLFPGFICLETRLSFQEHQALYSLE